jgi:hypothetical protein
MSVSNKHPWLISAGIKTPTPTRHTYTGSRAVINSAQKVVGYDQMFKCDVTGVERKFGFESVGHLLDHLHEGQS